MDIIHFNNVEDKIVILRGYHVILDKSVAELYGVETKRVNEAVKNNPDKFPEGYVFELNPDEWANLKSNFSTSSWGGTRKVSKAFTEKGLYMLATILKSEQATQTTIAIIEAFAKMRDLSRTVEQLLESSDEFVKESLTQRSGNILSDLIGEGLKTSDTETSIELNLAILKIKHLVKRKK